MNKPRLDLARWRERAPHLARMLGMGLAPLLVVWAEIFYSHFFYQWLYMGTTTFGYWLALLVVPLVAGEVAFTRAYEVRRYGWRIWVIAGLVGRLVFVLFCFWILVWMPMQEKGSLGIIHPLIGFWPWVTRMMWIASPYVGALLAVPLITLYVLGCRYRVGRWVTGVALPMFATLLLFNVFYFYSTAWWRFSNGTRPSYVEKVYPTKRLHAVPPGMPMPFQARDLYVDPEERYLALASGATMGSHVDFKPNFIWLDLLNGEMIYYMMGQNRRFTVECPGVMYFAPWKTRNLYKFDQLTRKISAYALPVHAQGYPVREFMHTVHACKLGRVYVANNNNPVVFVWDTRREKVIKTFELARLPGGRLGDSVGALLRNPKRGVLYVMTAGPAFQLVEIDERTLTVKRTVKLPYYAFDIAVSPDGRWIYSAGFLRGYVSKIDTRTLLPVARFDGPVHGRRVLVSRDGRWLYLASYLHGTFEVLDARTGRRHLRIFITPKIEGLFQSANYLWFYGAGGVFRVPFTEVAKRL